MSGAADGAPTRSRRATHRRERPNRAVPPTRADEAPAPPPPRPPQDPPPDGPTVYVSKYVRRPRPAAEPPPAPPPPTPPTPKYARTDGPSYARRTPASEPPRYAKTAKTPQQGRQARPIFPPPRTTRPTAPPPPAATPPPAAAPRPQAATPTRPTPRPAPAPSPPRAAPPTTPTPAATAAPPAAAPFVPPLPRRARRRPPTWRERAGAVGGRLSELSTDLTDGLGRTDLLDRLGDGIGSRLRRRPARGPEHRAPATLPTWSEPATKNGRLAGLDGIRALAVAAVIAYHAGLTWIPGGLLGVDAFFVLSGFLITTMLVAEWRRTGRIDLRQFWIRRARRLMPALLLVLLAVAAAAGIFGVGKASLRLDALAALAYVANWRFALSDQGYFAHFTPPSPLLHLWSLGVEEQFYVLWPLLTIVVLRGQRRRRGHRVLLTAALAGAALSTVLLVTMHAAGVGTSRLYYGTDTRAAALLVGAGLAAWRVARPARIGRLSRWLLQLVGLVGAAAMFYAWFEVDGQSPFLYEGGFLLVALTVAAVVAAVVENPSGPLGRLLTLRPLPYVGRLSYGLYLWHWPVMLALTHARTHVGGVFLLALRLLVTYGLAALSYTYVETPIRTRRFRLPVPRLTAPVTLAGTAALVIVATAGTSSAGDLDSVAAGQRSLSVGQLVQQRRAEPATPRSVLVVGDSVAYTLARAMGKDDQRRYGVTVVNAARVGCGVAPGDLVVVPGGVGFPQAPQCLRWPTEWAQEVAALHPSVALLLVGRWEIADRRIDGKLVHIGQPAYDAALEANILHGVDVLGGSGSTVALATAPCFDSAELPDGSRNVQDDPARLATYNRLVRAVAAQRPGEVRVLDLYGQLCGGGTYHKAIDGQQVRDADGVHFVKTPSHVLGSLVLPRLRALAPATPRTATARRGPGR